MTLIRIPGTNNWINPYQVVSVQDISVGEAHTVRINFADQTTVTLRSTINSVIDLLKGKHASTKKG